MQRLPEPLRSRAVNFLYNELHPDTIEELRRFYERDPDWGDQVPPEARAEIKERYGFYVPTPFHFGAGMAFRNLLRQEIKDAELPPSKDPINYGDRNWDDYYLDVIEGVLELPPKEEPPEIPWYDAPRRTLRRLREMGVL